MEYQIQDGKEITSNSNSIVWVCMVLDLRIKG
jgi:hypothetical protein